MFYGTVFAVPVLYFALFSSLSLSCMDHLVLLLDNCPIWVAVPIIYDMGYESAKECFSRLKMAKFKCFNLNWDF